MRTRRPWLSFRGVPLGRPAGSSSTRASRACIASLCALLATLGAAHAEAQVPASTAAAPPTVAAAPPAAPTSSTAKALELNLNLKIQRVSLRNGLRVVLNEDHSSPTVAVSVTYDVGSRNEQQGRSGFAHLFEHMMFQGSRNVAKGQHFMLITERGGTLNGTTSVDRTNYFELAPSNGLSTVLWLEADRMKTLAVTAENFENQRSVVQEEYRMRVSNAAYAQGLMRLRELVFQGYWPHEHDPIGSMRDLDQAQLDWIRAFHKAYYAPNNAVLTLAGDFDSAEAVALIDRYFSDAVPSAIPEYKPGLLPEQTTERSEELSDANAKTPALMNGWAIPPNRTEEHYALELATLILGYGDSSVLTAKLVHEEGLLRGVGVWTYDHRGPDFFVVQALLTERADVLTVQKRLDDEFARLATTGPTAAEVAKAKQHLQSFFLFGLEGNQARAIQLGSFELFFGDASAMNTELARYRAVSPEHIQQAVKKYLTVARRSRITVLPSRPATAKPADKSVATTPPAQK